MPARRRGTPLPISAEARRPSSPDLVALRHFRAGFPLYWCLTLYTHAAGRPLAIGAGEKRWAEIVPVS